jgi:hypothetical protein
MDTDYRCIRYFIGFIGLWSQMFVHGL